MRLVLSLDIGENRQGVGQVLLVLSEVVHLPRSLEVRLVLMMHHGVEQLHVHLGHQALVSERLDGLVHALVVLLRHVLLHELVEGAGHVDCEHHFRSQDGPQLVVLKVELLSQKGLLLS